MKHLRCVGPLLLALLLTLVTTTRAQAPGADIDFKDLARPGRPAVRVYPIPGLEKEAARWHDDFTQTDRSERQDSAARMSAHEAARGSCNRQGNCYTVKAIRSKRAEVLCNAGMKRGSEEWISIDGPDRYNCNMLGCNKTLHEAALSACNLS